MMEGVSLSWYLLYIKLYIIEYIQTPDTCHE